MHTKQNNIIALFMGIVVGISSYILAQQLLSNYAPDQASVFGQTVTYNNWDYFQTVFGYYHTDISESYLNDQLTLWFLSFIYYFIGCMLALNFLKVSPSYWQMILVRTGERQSFHNFFLKGSFLKLSIYTVAYFLTVYILSFNLDIIGNQSSFMLQETPISIELFLIIYAVARLITLLVFQRFAYILYINNKHEFASILTVVLLALALEADKALPIINLFYFEIKTSWMFLIWIILFMICLFVQNKSSVYWEDV